MISKDPKSCQQTIAIINTSFFYSIAGSLPPNIPPVKKNLTSIKSMFSCDNYVNETTKVLTTANLLNISLLKRPIHTFCSFTTFQDSKNIGNLENVTVERFCTLHATRMGR
jgi:hypothetical protein